MKFVMSLVIAFLVLMNLGQANHHTPPGKKLYQSLPRAERLDFLVFSLGDGYTKNTTTLNRQVPDLPFPDALGINNDLIEKFKTLEVPDNFTSNMYFWIRSQFNLDQENIRKLILYRSVCLSNGECIDIGDIGGLCCPF